MTTNEKETAQSPSKKPGSPKWATQPFRDFLEHTERLSQLLHLSTRGISMLPAMPKMVEVLAEIDQDDTEEAVTRIERAKQEAELARREIEEGFPLLHAQASIALWSALEAAIRTFLARWLQNHKPAMEIEAIQKLRVRIGDYERLEGEDRFFYILDRLEQELSSPAKSGVTRFESLLDPFGLSGAVNDEVRRDLFELSQVRNALLHRSGVADRRLVESCPWLNLNVGELLRIDRRKTERYFACVMMYATEIIVRIGEYFGTDMSKFRGESQTQQEAVPATSNTSLNRTHAGAKRTT